MWMKLTADVKCPRGDCKHYDCNPDEPPCRFCTCNRSREGGCRHFAYESRLKPERRDSDDPR